MDLHITQKEAARRVGADQLTLINWEKERTQPAVRFVPAIVRFLGFDPFRRGETLGQRLRTARRARGLSHTALALELGVDPSTILNWELERHRPPVRYRPRILGLIDWDALPPEARLVEPMA